MKPENDLESQMLDALELFHYASRYRDELLTLVLENEVRLVDLASDIKVLLHADIVTTIVCQGNLYVEELTKRLSERGLPLHYIAVDIESALSTKTLAQLQELLTKRTTPVVGLSAFSGPPPSNREIWELGLKIADCLEATKAFIVSPHEGLTKDNSPISLLSHSQLQHLRQSKCVLNLQTQLLDLVEHYIEFENLDIVVLSGTAGSLFREIFTHLGSGTLFTDDHPNIIRQAKLTDAFDIANLTKPWVKTRTLLPVDDDDVAKNIDSFFVYTVDNSIAAAARLIRYDDSAQIARVCTLPRYQRRGYAKELVQHLVSVAQANNIKLVFGLSIKPHMWQLFQDLGFIETDRNLLPDQWKKNYDFTRPSKAFCLKTICLKESQN